MIRILPALICLQFTLCAMDNMSQPSILQARIKERTDRIAQLKYSIVMTRINVAVLNRKLGIYPCSGPKLIARGDSDSSCSYNYSDTEENMALSLFD